MRSRLALLGLATVLAGCEALFGVDFGDVPTSDGARDGGQGGDGRPSTIGDAMAEGALDAQARRDSGDAAAPACDGPCPIEQISSLPSVTELAVDEKNVYFAQEVLGGAVFQCPKTGCGEAPLRLGAGYTNRIAVDATHVYWGEYLEAGRLVACAIGGCADAPTALATSQQRISYVSLDGASLFWTVDGAVMRCNPRACSPAVVTRAPGFVAAFAADRGRLFWSVPAGQGVVGCVAASCASPTALGPGGSGLSAHAGKVYWTHGGAIVSCDADGCGEAPFTIGSSANPGQVVSDGVTVYWRTLITDTIYACPIGGCGAAPRVLATKQRGTGIAVDAAHVYWTTVAGVFRLRK